MMYRWRILERRRIDDGQLLEAVARLAEAEPADFKHLLRLLQQSWEEHLERVSELQTRATRVLKQGQDLSVRLRAEHDAMTQVFENFVADGG